MDYHTLPDGTCVIIITIPGDNHCLFHSMSFGYNQIDHTAPQEHMLSGHQLRNSLAANHIVNPQMPSRIEELEVV